MHFSVLHDFSSFLASLRWMEWWVGRRLLSLLSKTFTSDYLVYSASNSFVKANKPVYVCWSFVILVLLLSSSSYSNLPTLLLVLLLLQSFSPLPGHPTTPILQASSWSSSYSNPPILLPVLLLLQSSNPPPDPPPTPIIQSFSWSSSDSNTPPSPNLQSSSCLF